jgi:pimeloyl-ACP methyl ester carboxylesterase
VHVADLVALIERLGRSPVDLLGHSYGGAVAALLAQSRPDLIRKLVLVEPALYSLWPFRPLGEEYVRGLSASRKKMRAKIDSGQDPVAIVRAMYDDDRPGRFESFPAWRRQTLVDNARTTAPLFVNSLLSEPFGCRARHPVRRARADGSGRRRLPGPVGPDREASAPRASARWGVHSWCVDTFSVRSRCRGLALRDRACRCRIPPRIDA